LSCQRSLRCLLTNARGLQLHGVEDHVRWSGDIASFSGTTVNYPLISDPELKIAKLYGMLPETEENSAAERTAMDNATARTVFVIGPDKKIKATVSYPMTTGRDFDEILRVIDSLQLTARHQLATPANWKKGEDAVITPAVTNEAAKERFPQGWSTPLPYLRLVGAPN
ncbi:MAG: redoxin domain-containing protein, partial [Pseudomonadota bacterium]